MTETRRARTDLSTAFLTRREEKARIRRASSLRMSHKYPSATQNSMANSMFADPPLPCPK